MLLTTSNIPLMVTAEAKETLMVQNCAQLTYMEIYFACVCELLNNRSVIMKIRLD